MARSGFLAVAAFAGLAAANLARPSPAATPTPAISLPPTPRPGLSVMTYNVKGLPFPAAYGRPSALAEIGQRLAALRRQGRQPDVVALQEAFIPEAKAIAAQAGYRYVAVGPQPSDAGTGAPADASWSRGETAGKWVDSGLLIMSDHPILATRRMAYSSDACAGYDCMAAKGVLIAWVRAPGLPRPVAIADTHLNSRHASGVSAEKANAAYRLQVDQARQFIRSAVSPRTGLVFAGDFNVGHDPVRIAMTDGAFAGPAGMAQAIGPSTRERSTDLAAVVRRAKDKEYFRSGSAGQFHVDGVHVPFGLADGGLSLSDHLGVVVDYAVR